MDVETRQATGIAKAAVVLEAIIFMISLFTLYTVFNYEILPLRYRLILTGVLFIINLMIFIFIGLGFHRKKFAWLSFITSFLILVFAGVAVYYLQSGVGALNTMGIGGTGYIRKTNFTIRVLTNSPIAGINEIEGLSVSAPYASDKENIDTFYADFEKKEKIGFNLIDSGSYRNGVADLYDGNTQVILFNESFLPIILEEHPNFATETRVLSEHTVSVKVEDDKEKTDVANQPFTVYISGIDTSGAVDTTSRSDVNILMTVNPNTKKILTVSVPRDSYVAIAGGGNNQMDKLTHAGIYGVESSRDTLANLFDTKIDYWVRVNFSSVINIVDILGGVEVDNPRDFTGPGGYYFPAGQITLDGEEALSFSRERYSIEGGDIGRGKNQEIVLKGIINKLSGREVLGNFTSLLKVAEESMQTNMQTNEMMRLVNLQLDDGRSWDISSQSLSGYGETGLPSYAMPGWNLYMYVLDEDSVATAKQVMDAIKAGN